MTSQKWLNESYWYHTKENAEQKWFHMVTIWVPDDINEKLADSAFLIIAGGNNGNGFGYGKVEQTYMRGTGLYHLNCSRLSQTSISD